MIENTEIHDAEGPQVRGAHHQVFSADPVYPPRQACVLVSSYGDCEVIYLVHVDDFPTRVGPPI